VHGEGSVTTLAKVLEDDGVTAYISPEEFDFEWTFKEILDDGNSIGFFVCSDDSGDNAYLVRVGSGDEINLYTKVGGSFTMLAGVAAPEDSGLVKLEVRTSSLTLFLDGAQVFTTSNVDHARQGRVIVRNNPSSASANNAFHIGRVGLRNINPPASTVATPVNPSITNLLATSARLNWEQG